jgi:hypothetical protein
LALWALLADWRLPFEWRTAYAAIFCVAVPVDQFGTFAGKLVGLWGENLCAFAQGNHLEVAVSAYGGVQTDNLAGVVSVAKRGYQLPGFDVNWGS